MTDYQGHGFSRLSDQVLKPPCHVQKLWLLMLEDAGNWKVQLHYGAHWRIPRLRVANWTKLNPKPGRANHEYTERFTQVFNERHPLTCMTYPTTAED